MRYVFVLICVLAALVLAGGILAPIAGMGWAVADPRQVSTELVAVPGPGPLAARSLILAAVATLGAILLGIPPAAVLGSLGWGGGGRARMRAASLWGLTLAPLLVPPQVYAYAWGLVTLPGGITGSAGGAVSWWGPSVRAGLISAGWLWPVVAVVLAAGWRTTGRSTFRLALLDTSPGRAFIRAVVPSLRAYLVAAASVVFVLTLIEYPIPHLTLARVYATELLVLCDVGAPPGQVMRMAGQVIVLVLAVAAGAIWAVRGIGDWESLGGNEEGGPSGRASRPQLVTLLGAAAVWAGSILLPVGFMLAELRVRGAWTQGLSLFTREWSASLTVALLASAFSVVLAIGTVVLGASLRRAQVFGRRLADAAVLAILAAAIMPAAALGIGFVRVFNASGTLRQLYTDTPLVWTLGLTARYAAVVVVLATLALRKRAIEAAEQARIDGAGAAAVSWYVLLPLVWPSLLAGGMIVAVLALFEVVVAQLLQPVAYPSIALAILGHMHYGRDDVVITTSLWVVAFGVLVTQATAWLLMRRDE
jgi:iron(III) transport system permease protein